METDAVIEEAEVVSLTDEQIEAAVGILAGRAAAIAFDERVGNNSN